MVFALVLALVALAVIAAALVRARASAELLVHALHALRGDQQRALAVVRVEAQRSQRLTRRDS